MLRWGLGIRGRFRFLPLNPLRTPSPPLKRAGTPCTRERGLRPGLTALRGASGGWVTGVEPAHIIAFAGAKTLVENEKGWFDHPFFSLPNTTHGCNSSSGCNGNTTGGCNASMSCNRNTTSSCNASTSCNQTQPAVAMYLSVAIEHNPRLPCIQRLQREYNRQLQSIYRLQSNTTSGCNPLPFTAKNKDCVKLLFCEVFSRLPERCSGR